MSTSWDPAHCPEKGLCLHGSVFWSICVSLQMWTESLRILWKRNYLNSQTHKLMFWCCENEQIVQQLTESEAEVVISSPFPTTTPPLALSVSLTVPCTPPCLFLHTQPHAEWPGGQISTQSCLFGDLHSYHSTLLHFPHYSYYYLKSTYNLLILCYSSLTWEWLGNWGILITVAFPGQSHAWGSINSAEWMIPCNFFSGTEDWLPLS